MGPKTRPKHGDRDHSIRNFSATAAETKLLSQVFRCFRTCSDLFGPVRMHSDAFGCVRRAIATYRNTFPPAPRSYLIGKGILGGPVMFVFYFLRLVFTTLSFRLPAPTIIEANRVDLPDPGWPIATTILLHSCCERWLNALLSTSIKVSRPNDFDISEIC